MHLSHPTPALVRDLQFSQRLERRKAPAAPAGANGHAAPAAGPGEDLGWVPGGAAGGAGGGGDAGWVPPRGGDEYGEQDGDSWRPNKRR